MIYNKKGIQRQIIAERVKQVREDRMTLEEYFSSGKHEQYRGRGSLDSGLNSFIKSAGAAARRDMKLSWEDMCNPRITDWSANLKKANADMSNVMFGSTQWETTGKPDKTASTAMHMAWKPSDFPDTSIPKDVIPNAYKTGRLKVVWASTFIAGHCGGVGFAKVNEVKGKVEPVKGNGFNVDGKIALGLGAIADPKGGYHFSKFFTFGDKYVLLQTGTQKFALLMIKDTKTGKLVNKADQFAEIANSTSRPKTKPSYGGLDPKYLQ